MYIVIVHTRTSPPAVLLRQARREGGKIVQTTLANLSTCPPEAVEALRLALRGYPGVGWISALRCPAIRTLAEHGAFQPSLFNTPHLAEITSDAYPGERLVVCDNPALAADRQRTRDELLTATEARLARIAAAVGGTAHHDHRRRLARAEPAHPAERTGDAVQKHLPRRHRDERPTVRATDRNQSVPTARLQPARTRAMTDCTQ